MKKKLQSFKKTLQAGLAFLLVAVFIAGIFPTFNLTTEAANVGDVEFVNAIANLQTKFRNGEYWNSYNSCGYEGTGTTPCPTCSSRGQTYCNGDCPDACGQFYYNGVWISGQCLGFACKMGNAIFGGNPYAWPTHSNANNLKPGDIMYGNLTSILSGASVHAIFITNVSGNTVTYADCNSGGPCRVNWGRTTTLSAVRSAVNAGAKIYHASNNKVDSGSSTPSYSYTSITPGNYYLRNMSSGAFLRVADGVDVNQQNIDAWKPYDPGNTAQMFSITATADGYKMRPLCSSSRVVNAYGVSPASGANVNLYDDVNDSTQWWKFEKVDENCYIIHNTYISSCVLDFVDSGNALISSANGSRGQIWMLIPENHTHTKGQFVYRWSKHPHCNCYVCWTCGMDWADTNEPNKVESCEECYPKVHTCNYSKFLQYQTAHPHYAEYQCPDCGKTKTDTSKTTKMESCKTCYPPAPPSEKNTYYFKETYNKDGTISVLIGIDTAGVVAVQGSVAFNREDLELVSYRDSGSFDSFSGPQTIDVANQDGVMYYFASSATKTNNLTGKIPVFTAVFRPKKDTETTLSGAVESASDTDLNQVSFAVSEKTFPTVDPSPKIVRGDVNGDGEVNAIDGAILSRYLAKWKVEINRANADINGDGEVNSADGALLSRHLAKWNIEYFN